MHTAGICTLGCKVNQYESRVFAESLEKYGVKICDFSQKCDIYILNTCAVTSESDRKARQMVRRAVSCNPLAYVIVTGCYAQLDPNAVAAISGVDFVCGNRNKLKAVEAALEFMKRGQKNSEALVINDCLDGAVFEPMSIVKPDPGHTRAFVKIQDGCSSNCSYCIIPTVRGDVRSKPADDVFNEVKTLADGGCREVVLTGIETSAYGYNLAELIKRLNGIDSLERIRLGSLDPSFMRAGLIDQICGLEKVMPHFHLSMQSGSNRILALMKRRYNTQMAYENMEYIKSKRPETLFTTDIMTGFPNETDSDFNSTLKFAELVRFLHIHIFTYSKRPGTPAAYMSGQIPEKEKVRRAAVLSEFQSEIKKSVLEGIISKGKPLTVLFEETENGFLKGHSEEFAEVYTEPEGGCIGKTSKVMPTKIINNIIFGTIIK